MGKEGKGQRATCRQKEKAVKGTGETEIEVEMRDGDTFTKS